MTSATAAAAIPDFAALREAVRERGLLESQPRYYAFKFVSTLALAATGVAIVVMVDQWWVQIINAAFFAFVSTQLGFLGHDAGHRQVGRGARMNEVLNLGIGNLLLGVSASWWVSKHNAHHRNPNDLDSDPDVQFPIFAFSPLQARRIRGAVPRFVVKRQAFFIVPLFTFGIVNMRMHTIGHLRSARVRRRRLQVALLLAHLALYLSLLFVFLSVWEALAFLAIHQALFGLYMGSTFATNHKGMPTLTGQPDVDFVRRQVSTTRNVTPHPVTDFVLGGLNYQIEHHLFPSMPRNKLREARELVRPFCEARGVEYRESSLLRTYADILRFLHAMGAPLRRGASPEGTSSAGSVAGEGRS